MKTDLLVSIALPLLSGAVSAAIISGLFAILSKRMEFSDEYYKQIIERRMDAYAELERLIHSIKVAVLDSSDGQLYHELFSKDDDYQRVYILLHDVMSKSLWLSNGAFEETRQLNLLVFRNTSSVSGTGLIAFGKTHYREIARLRERLEVNFAADLLRLHKVSSFLRSKRPRNNFEDLQINR